MYYLKKDQVAEFLEGELPFSALMRNEVSCFSRLFVQCIVMIHVQ